MARALSFCAALNVQSRKEQYRRGQSGAAEIILGSRAAMRDDKRTRRMACGAVSNARAKSAGGPHVRRRLRRQVCRQLRS